MKSKTLSNEQGVKLSIEVISLTDTLCAFKAVKTTTENNKTTIEESEGITETEKVHIAKKKCLLPSVDSYSYFKKNDAFLDLIKVYGYQYFLNDTVSFNDFFPYQEMNKVLEKSLFTFDEIKNGTLDDVMDNLIHLKSSSGAYILVKTGKLINTAVSLDKLLINEARYRNFKKIIEQMIEDKRIVVQDNFSGKILIRNIGSYLKSVNGLLQFSDKEWNYIIENIEIEDDHFESSALVKIVQENDMLGINKNLKTKEEIEADEKCDRDRHC